MAAIILAVGLFGSFTNPQPVSAGLPVSVLTNIPQLVKDIYEKIEKALGAALINAGTRAATYALRKVAYDSAVWIASGGKGQGALVFRDGFGTYIGNVANEAAGDAIDELGEDFGLNLCKIPDIKIDLALKVGLRTKYGPEPKPACTGIEFLKNWQSGFSKYTNSGSIMQSFNLSLKGDPDSDFGIYMQAVERINDKIYTQEKAAIYDRQEGGGFKADVEKVSGQVKTPAALVGETAKSITPDKTVAENKRTLDAAVASNEVKVFPQILSIFLSTLGSNIINNFQTKGILPFGACIGGYGGEECKKAVQNISGGLGSSGGTGYPSYDGEGLAGLDRAVAKSFFTYLTAVKIKESTNFDLISTLNSCPDSPGIYNCRAGDDLVLAMDQRLTIKEAIDKGVLDGNKLLIPPSDPKSNSLECFREAYCLNNVKTLRQVRVLPLGFELAVQNSDPELPWKLREVVEGFHTSSSPYYRLIDPNWVLKAPDAKCNALVYGPTLLSYDVPDRLQDCVDLQTCVSYNSNGNCAQYAYCTKERNSWNFAADKCDSQFATCQTFKKSSGENVSYLYRTLDTSYCNSSNVGCRAFSLEKDSSGNWVEPTYDSATNKNSGIYLNNKVTTGCSSSSAGCSAFQIASSPTEDLLYLKRAPDYLKCYDSNTTTPEIEWPQNNSEILAIKGDSTCKNFAAVCSADEVSCGWYAPLLGGTKIPGKFKPAEIIGSQVKWNDQCDQKCVGYDSYREMPSTYTNGADLAYIIPSSGTKCTAQEEGCSSFTNLSTVSGKAEKTEYYTYLRPCVLPENSQKTKTYITYEGTKESGFQLRTYRLVENEDPDNGEIGAPKYFYKDEVELQKQVDECNETRYKEGFASLDCRQFNDEEGKIYYRLLSKTIPVSESCTPYRITTPEFYFDESVAQEDCAANRGAWDDDEGSCKFCLQNGEYRNGGCIYMGIPAGSGNFAGESKACLASVDTCRAFKGNAGNNIQVVFTESFEGESAISGWTSPNTTISGVSTHVGEHSLEYSGNASAVKGLTLEPGKSYELTFWATGEAGAIDVTLDGSTSNNFGRFIVKEGAWDDYRLTLSDLRSTTSTVNLTFTHVAGGRFYLDNIRLVKITDLQYLVKKSLKVDPLCDSTPNDGLPGEALGCKAYTDSAKNTLYLKNFSSLCREEAIGCTAFKDTYNTEDKKVRAYNVWLPSGNPINLPNGAKSGSCTPDNKKGEFGCYINLFGYTAAEIASSSPGSLVDSTIYLPADSEKEIYLVANQTASCNKVDLGCTYAGIASTTNGVTSFVTTTIKNDPAMYDEILCEKEALGCNAFTDGAGSVYFKDPSLIGQSICTYRKDVVMGGTRINGWFKLNASGANEPCYPSVFVNGEYGILSYGTPQYNNNIGECPPEQNKCTEFRDHGDVTNGTSRSYYRIKDEKVNSGDCNGQVSQKSGCALFEEIGQNAPTNSMNTVASYAASNQANGILVDPVAGNDANRIIKVERDRDCGEWLECDGSHVAYDEQSTKTKTVCDSMLRCKAADGNFGCGNGTGEVVTASYTNQMLTPELYRARGVSWNDMEYDGYSILGQYPLEELKARNIGSELKPDIRLVKNGVTSTPKICRAYPEKDSPFPSTDKVEKFSDFEEANVCNEADDPACECDYRKVEYGDAIKKYWAYDKTTTKDSNVNMSTTTHGNPPRGICLGGMTPAPARQPLDGYACTVDSDCGEGGSCQLLKAERYLRGWKGFCLEYDSNRRLNGEENNNQCLTWYPLDTLLGTEDINFQNYEAGGDWRGTAGLNGGFYCLHAQGSGVTDPALTSFNIKFSAAGVDHLGELMVDQGYGPTKMGRTRRLNDGSQLGEGHVFQRSHVDVENSYIGDPAYSTTRPYSTDLKPLFNNIKREFIDQIQVEVISSAGYETQKARASTEYFIFPNETNATRSQPTYLVNRNDMGSTEATNGLLTGGFYPNYKASPSYDSSFVMLYSPASQAYPANIHMYYDVGDTGAVYGTKVGFDQSTGEFKSMWKDNEAIGTQGIMYGNGTDPLLYTTLSDNRKIDLWSHELPNNRSNEYGDYCPTLRRVGNSAGIYYPHAWHALRLNFDSEGRFKSIDTAFCGKSAKNRSGRQDYWVITSDEEVEYKITFKLKEYCTDIVDARVNLSERPSVVQRRTVAQTNRLWHPQAGFTVPSLNYSYTTDLDPFGSIGQTFPTSLVHITKPESRNCAALTTDGGMASSNIVSCNMPASTAQVPFSSDGAPYSCNFAGCVRTENNGVRVSTTAGSSFDGVSPLATLFASIAGNYKYNWQTRTYEFNGYYESPLHAGDAMTQRKPVPPQIRPVDCTFINSGQTQICKEVPTPGFSVNGTSTIDVVEARYSYLRARVQFYMFADDNQMPLRRVAIDWDEGKSTDGSGAVIPLLGAFRNFRGLTQAGAEQCVDRTAATGYGFINGVTCENKYFQQEKVYTCKQGDPRWKPQSDCGAPGESATDVARKFPYGCCVYQPKVQVLDNWGWCNGSCNTGGIQNGCYNVRMETCYDDQMTGVTAQNGLTGRATPFGKLIKVRAAQP